jgi:hypothetical protein
LRKIPEISPEVRRAAVDKAVRLRTSRAQIKRKLKDGEISFFDLEDIDMEIKKGFRTLEILESLPGVGKLKARNIMEDLNISPRKKLTGLGARQKSALQELVSSHLNAGRKKVWSQKAKR